MLAIEFPRTIEESKVIYNMSDLLFDERSGILNWSLEGLGKLKSANY